MIKTVRAGIIRNKFELLLQIKSKAKRKQSRFAKKSSQKTNVSLSQSSYQNGLLHKDSGIQLGILTTLPPEWVEKYDDCQIILRQVDDIKKQISILHSKRLSTINEKQQSSYDRQIYDKATTATRKITECQRILRQIRANVSQNTEGIICKNLCSSLAVSIQQKTKQIRGQQKLYIEQRKRIENSTKVSFLDLAVQNVIGGQMYQDDIQMLQIQDLHVQQRSKEITKLIYKQMSNLVLVQGTLLDRIDVNLDTTIQNVQKGNKNLNQVIKRQQSPFAKRCICIMITTIIILGFVLVLKFSR